MKVDSVDDQLHQGLRVRHRTEAQAGAVRVGLQQPGGEGDQQDGVHQFARVHAAD
jgi:hypothetical protein